MLMEADGEANTGWESFAGQGIFRLSRTRRSGDLARVAALKGIRVDDRGVHIGAMTTWRGY